MKVKCLILLLLLLAVGACDKNEAVKHLPLTVLSQLSGENGLTYSESLNKWNALKSLHGNSYTYQTMFTSFSGSGSITELRIENGIITSRIYQEYKISDDGVRDIISSYTETAGTLGTHEKGAPLRTIDELYETCAKDYLTVDAETNTIYFQTAEFGLMTLCAFVPGGCMDDCFRGVNINAFDWLQ